MCDHAVVTSQIGYNGSLLSGTFGANDIEIRACLDMNQVVFNLWEAITYLNNNPVGLPTSPTNGFVLYGNTDGSVYWDAPSGGGSQTFQNVLDTPSSPNATIDVNWDVRFGSPLASMKSVIRSLYDPSFPDDTLTAFGSGDLDSYLLGTSTPVGGVLVLMNENQITGEANINTILNAGKAITDSSFVNLMYDDGALEYEARFGVQESLSDFVYFSITNFEGSYFRDTLYEEGFGYYGDYGESGVTTYGDRAIIDKGHIDRLNATKIIYHQFTGTTDYTLSVGYTYVFDFNSSVSNSIYIPNPTTCMEGYSIRVRVINAGANNNFVVSGSGDMWFDGNVGDIHPVTDGYFEFMFDETTNMWYKIN